MFRFLLRLCVVKMFVLACHSGSPCLVRPGHVSLKTLLPEWHAKCSKFIFFFVYVIRNVMALHAVLAAILLLQRSRATQQAIMELML